MLRRCSNGSGCPLRPARRMGRRGLRHRRRPGAPKRAEFSDALYRRPAAHRTPALQITAQPAAHALTSAADDLKAAPAWLALQTMCDARLERLPRERSACEAGQSASAVGLDMAGWWEPTAEGFRSHQGLRQGPDPALA